MRWLRQRQEEEQAAAVAAQRTEEDLPDMDLETCAIMTVREAGAAQPATQAAATEASGMDAEPAQPERQGCSPVPAAAVGAEDATQAEGAAAASAPPSSPDKEQTIAPAQPGEAAGAAQLSAKVSQAQAAAAGQAASTAAQAGSALLPQPAAAQHLVSHPAPFTQATEPRAAPAAGTNQPAELEAALAAAFGQVGQLDSGPEPTMTIGTRDAFAAINQMFGVRPGGLVYGRGVLQAGLARLPELPSGAPSVPPMLHRQMWHAHTSALLPSVPCPVGLPPRGCHPAACRGRPWHQGQRILCPGRHRRRRVRAHNDHRHSRGLCRSEQDV